MIWCPQCSRARLCAKWTQSGPRTRHPRTPFLLQNTISMMIFKIQCFSLRIIVSHRFSECDQPTQTLELPQKQAHIHNTHTHTHTHTYIHTYTHVPNCDLIFLYIINPPNMCICLCACVSEQSRFVVPLCGIVVDISAAAFHRPQWWRVVEEKCIIYKYIVEDEDQYIVLVLRDSTPTSCLVPVPWCLLFIVYVLVPCMSHVMWIQFLHYLNYIVYPVHDHNHTHTVTKYCDQKLISELTRHPIKFRPHKY